VLALVVGFSVVVTWPSDLLEGNILAIDTLVYEDIEKVYSFVAIVSSSLDVPLLMHSQLLARLKSESKYKTTERGGVGARSLAHNTLKGRRPCWSSRMGLGRVDKLHSLTWACTQPTQSG